MLAESIHKWMDHLKSKYIVLLTIAISPFRIGLWHSLTLGLIRAKNISNVTFVKKALAQEAIFWTTSVDISPSKILFAISVTCHFTAQTN